MKSTTRHDCTGSLKSLLSSTGNEIRRGAGRNIRQGRVHEAMKCTLRHDCNGSLKSQFSSKGYKVVCLKVGGADFLRNFCVVGVKNVM